jgi:hypothetical protein
MYLHMVEPSGFKCPRHRLWALARLFENGGPQECRPGAPPGFGALSCPPLNCAARATRRRRAAKEQAMATRTGSPSQPSLRKLARPARAALPPAVRACVPAQLPASAPWTRCGVRAPGQSRRPPRTHLGAGCENCQPEGLAVLEGCKYRACKLHLGKVIN